MDCFLCSQLLFSPFTYIQCDTVTLDLTNQIIWKRKAYIFGRPMMGWDFSFFSFSIKNFSDFSFTPCLHSRRRVRESCCAGNCYFPVNRMYIIRVFHTIFSIVRFVSFRERLSSTRKWEYGALGRMKSLTQTRVLRTLNLHTAWGTLGNVWSTGISWFHWPVLTGKLVSHPMKLNCSTHAQNSSLPHGIL